MQTGRHSPSPPEPLQAAFSHVDARLLRQAARAPGVAALVQAHKGAAGLILQADAAGVAPLQEGLVLTHRIVPAQQEQLYRRSAMQWRVKGSGRRRRSRVGGVSTQAALWQQHQAQP